ncbi:MAG: hypothetical protein LC667_02740 [Thioalkalivibrio sp.]|nr:hypothetical protein [Thioalkalivibrio sp.]
MLRQTVALFAAPLLLGAAAPTSAASVCTEADPCYDRCYRNWERCELMGGTDCDANYNWCIDNCG